MIDPKTRLAFAFANAPGTAAVLLGAGVSRSANIQSGWEILVTLIQRIAVAEKHDPPAAADAESWFAQHTGSPPTYSNVMEAIAPTPALRHAVLARFFDTTQDTPREPTPTHLAVARLVAAGLVRVIVTTNFDRLMEQALEGVGITPRVVASVAQVAGMTPLPHAACTIIKVHGDYVLGDLRNSDAEIGAYPEAVDRLLDRVFDEYGLFVVGWSGTWDHALRAAIERAPGRRYLQTWLAVGGVSDVATALIGHRGMDTITAADADGVIPGIADTAIALYTAGAPSPDTEFALIERQKRYLRAGTAGDMDHLLMLGEVRDQLFDVIAKLPTSFSSQTSPEQWSQYRAVAESLEAHSAAACSLAIRSLRFGTTEVQAFWVRSIAQLAHPPSHSGNTALLELHRYPAILVAYAYALGAFLRADGKALNALWTHETDDSGNSGERLIDAASMKAIERRNLKTAFKEADQSTWKAPGSRRALALLLPRLTILTGSETDAERAFARVEYLWALAMAVRTFDSYGGIDGFVGHHLFTRGAGLDFANQVVDGKPPWDWILPSGCLQTTSAETVKLALPGFTEENKKHAF